MNLVHAAHALGFAAQWVTGWIAYDEVAGRILGLQPGERFVAIIQIGTSTSRRSTVRARRCRRSSASGRNRGLFPEIEFGDCFDPVQCIFFTRLVEARNLIRHAPADGSQACVGNDEAQFTEASTRSSLIHRPHSFRRC
jgi:hypothetical protein